MIPSKTRRRVKHVLSSEKATIQIGKDGTSEQVISEIDRQLESRGMVKVKMLKTALYEADAKKAASETAKRVDSEVIDVRGHTFTLYRRKRPRK